MEKIMENNVQESPDCCGCKVNQLRNKFPLLALTA
jgi:hypothetical protein